MHNLLSNFHLFWDITKSVFKSSMNADGNFKFYPQKPKMSDCQLIALSVSAEFIGIDSKNHLFGKLKKDYKDDFPYLIDKCNFNRRRKQVAPYRSN